MNRTHFDRMTMILRSAGFVTTALVGGQNAVNFAYILYLRGRAENIPVIRQAAGYVWRRRSRRESLVFSRPVSQLLIIALITPVTSAAPPLR